MPFDKQQLTHFHAACTDSPRAACSAISRYVRQELEEAERRIARYQEAFESGDMPAKQAADRVQELMNRKAELEDTLRKVVPIRPPPYLYTAANIERFQESLKEMFLSGDNPMTRNYLRFLVEGITVTDEQIDISARTDAALRLMAGGSRQEKTESVNPSVVSPTMGLAWLPLVDTFRTLCLAPTSEVRGLFEQLGELAA